MHTGTLYHMWLCTIVLSYLPGYCMLSKRDPTGLERVRFYFTLYCVLCFYDRPKCSACFRSYWVKHRNEYVLLFKGTKQIWSHPMKYILYYVFIFLNNFANPYIDILHIFLFPEYNNCKLHQMWVSNLLHIFHFPLPAFFSWLNKCLYRELLDRYVFPLSLYELPQFQAVFQTISSFIELLFLFDQHKFT